jgi:hypothetical protein
VPDAAPLPGLGLAWEAGRLTGAARVRAIGCSAEADGAGWRFRPG